MTEPVQPRPIRMSGAGHCPRRQAYLSLSYEQSNPADAAGRNRMALGDAAERLIIEGMLGDGWTVSHTQATPGGHQLEIARHDPPMEGHPDGVCQHPILTQNRRFTLEAKSMSPPLLQRVMEEGLAIVYPEYLDQAAVYTHHMHEHHLVDEPLAAVFATMDREGRPAPPQLVTWPRQYVPQAIQRLRQTWDTIQRGQLPPRPFLPDDKHCVYCPFRTECHGTPQPQDRSRQSHQAPEAAPTGQQWLDATAVRNQAREELIKLCPDHTHPAVIAGPITASWFIPTSEPRYSPDVLARYLTNEQINEARLPDEPKQAFWIRANHRGAKPMTQPAATEPQDLAYRVCTELLSEATHVLDACEADPNPWAARYRFDALKPVVNEIGRQIKQLPDPAERDTCQQLFDALTQKGSRMAPSIPVICQTCDEPFAFDLDQPRATTCGRSTCTS